MSVKLRGSIFAVCLTGLLLLTGCASSGQKAESKSFRVEQEGTVLYEGRLSAEAMTDEGEKLRFTGSHGEYIVEVRNGKVRMLSAQCPDKLCVKQGWVSHTYEPIICLPQKVIISIEEAPDAQEIDGLAQ